MNKLVSKNPILRFKEGLKILKFKKAGIISYKGRDNKDYEAFSGPKGWYYREKGSNQILSMPKNYVTTTGIRFYDTNGNMINNPSTTVPITKKSFQKGFLGDDVEKAPAGIIVKGDSNREKRIAPSRVTNRVLSKYSGVDLLGKTVGEWQSILKNYYAPGTKKKYMEDGIWGDATNAAYKLYLLSLALPKFTPELVSSPELVSNPESASSEELRRAIAMLDYTSNPLEQKLVSAPITYNRSMTRDWLRNNIGTAYGVSGAMRAATRRKLNGLASNDDIALIKSNLKLYDALKNVGLFKQGGQLPSRNVIKRFKQKNFRLVAQ